MPLLPFTQHKLPISGNRFLLRLFVVRFKTQEMKKAAGKGQRKGEEEEEDDTEEEEEEGGESEDGDSSDAESDEESEESEDGESSSSQKEEQKEKPNKPHVIRWLECDSNPDTFNEVPP